MCSETGVGVNVVCVVIYVVCENMTSVYEMNSLRRDGKGTFVMVIKKIKIVWQRLNKRLEVKLVIWFSTRLVMKSG